MKFIDWYRRFLEHTLATVENHSEASTPDAAGTPPEGQPSDWNVEWPHITGDDSAFWEEMAGQTVETPTKNDGGR